MERCPRMSNIVALGNGLFKVSRKKKKRTIEDKALLILKGFTIKANFVIVVGTEKITPKNMRKWLLYV